MKIKTILHIVSLCLILVMCGQLFSCNSGETPQTPTDPATDEPTDAPTDKPTEKPTDKPSDNEDDKDEPSDEDPNEQLPPEGGNDKDDEEIELPSYAADPDMTAMSLNKFLYPYWGPEVSFAESAFVRESEDGEIAPIQLLYPIDEIVSVRSYDLKTLFVEGEDYTVVDGKIVVNPRGDIPYLTWDEYFIEDYVQGTPGQIAAVNKPGCGYVYDEISGSDAGMSKWSIAVTYRHSGECPLTVPQTKSEKFTGLITKLENGENINYVSIGDSITYGWSATGTVNIAPYCPAYNILVQKYIEKEYDVRVEHTNLAVSGKNTPLGVERLDMICERNPDLVTIAFGMNNENPDSFMNNMNTMINTIKQKCPDAVVVVVSTCLANPQSVYYNHQPKYIGRLLEAEKNWTNAVVADVTTPHTEMLKVKTYQDTAGSNSNHPNDYCHRLYAQVILQTMFGNYVN